MYRIISGQWKCKRILAPRNFDVRPTTDFAKEALFSILEHRLDFSFVSALDLFAGIGSISLELASRGCKDITSVEMNSKHSGFIQTTAQELGFQLYINTQRGDVFDWLKKNRNRSKKFDLIFADPPFELPETQYQELISLALNNPYLSETGFLVVEHQSKMKLEHPNLKETRKYGNVSFSFFYPNETFVEESDSSI